MTKKTLLSSEVLLIVRSLDELSSPEEKLGALVRKYAELVRKCLGVTDGAQKHRA